MPENGKDVAREQRLVRVADLDKAIEPLATRTEVRLLILIGILGANFLPIQEAANAAISVVIP